MFISSCEKNPVSYGQPAEHLVRALLLIFLLSAVKLTGKSV